MKKLYLLTAFAIFSLFFSLSTEAQTQFDFSQKSDFFHHWEGDTADFLHDSANASMRLVAERAAGERSVWLKNENLIFTSWEAEFSMDFRPSSANYTIVYITANQKIIDGDFEGVYLKIGKAGAGNSVDFFHQKGTQHTLLAAGADDEIANLPSNQIAVKAKTDCAGNWVISAKNSGMDSFTTQATLHFPIDFTPAYSGFFFKYTATRHNLFWIHAFGHREKLWSSGLFEMGISEITDSQNIILQFSDCPDTSTLRPSNFSLQPLAVQPDSVVFLNENGSLLRLHFPEAFQRGQHYELHTSNILAQSQSPLQEASDSFYYFFHQKGDLVITEIMANPAAHTSSPDAAYIEFFNASGYRLEMENWQIQDRVSSAPISAATIEPNTYFILCNFEDTALFQPLGIEVIPVNLPSFNITNDDVRLFSPEGVLVDSLFYSRTWMSDMDKRDGGWSLEKIHPFHPCDDEENWDAGIDESGGTPGRENSIHDPRPDTTKLLVESFELLNPQYLKIRFQNPELLRKVDRMSANFPLERFSHEGADFDLFFKNPIPPNAIFRLKINDLYNCFGVDIAPDSLDILYYEVQKAKQNEVVVSEIYHITSASSSLPEAQFIEIYNRTDAFIDLSGWELGDRTRSVRIAEAIIYPNEYLILCHHSQVENFENFGKTVGLSSFPSFNTTEDEVNLLDESGHHIHHVNYQRSWYGDEIKAEGGWSLEMIDPENPCGGADNFTAAVNSQGGTPGKANSVSAENPFDRLPTATKIIPTQNPQVLTLHFSEAMDSLSLLQTSLYRFTNSNLKVDEALPIGPDYRRVALVLNQDIRPNFSYVMRVQKAKACDFSQSKRTLINFALADTAAEGDLVINELLPNPPDGVASFVEIYNQSEKVIDLREIYLANYHDDGAIRSLEEIAPEGHLLFPKAYLVLSTAPEDLYAHYTIKYEDRLLPILRMPSLPNRGGNIALISTSGKVIDRVDYTEDWHHALIRNHRGVSLERIRFDAASQSAQNWHSASENAGFATPGYENSQRASAGSEVQFKLEPQFIAPTNRQDLINLHYEFNDSGFRMSVAIYALNGQMIRKIATNEIVGKTGIYHWDGLDDAGLQPPTGAYIVLAKAYHPSGKQYEFKKGVLVGN